MVTVKCRENGAKGIFYPQFNFCVKWTLNSVVLYTRIISEQSRATAAACGFDMGRGARHKYCDL